MTVKQEHHCKFQAKSGTIKTLSQKLKARAVGERAQWLQILAALPDNLSSVPRTHVRQLIDTCNASSREYGTVIWLLQTPACVWLPDSVATTTTTTKTVETICEQTKWEQGENENLHHGFHLARIIKHHAGERSRLIVLSSVELA